MRYAAELEVVAEGGGGVRGDTVQKREQGGKLGREREPVPDRGVEERLLPDSISRKDKAFASLVPNCSSEHTADLSECVATALFIVMRDEVHIRARLKVMATAFEVAEPFAVSVQLAVADDGDGPILVIDGLIAAGEVDDREAPHAEDSVVGFVEPLSVRAAMREAAHGLPH